MSFDGMAYTQIELKSSRFVNLVSTVYGYFLVLQRVIEGNEPEPPPAALIKPTNGRLTWILDSQTAANLKQTSNMWDM